MLGGAPHTVRRLFRHPRRSAMSVVRRQGTKSGDTVRRVEMPRILGARDEFHLAAIAQNLRKLAKLIPGSQTIPAT